MTTGTRRPASEEALLAALAAAGGEAGPGELADLSGLAPRTVTKALGALRQAGLVEGNKARACLSLAGRQAAVPVALGAPSGSWEALLVELLPPWHAAAVRLAADMVVARALGPPSSPVPGMVVYGPVATYKSALAGVVCAMFGLDPVACVVHNSASLTPGAVIGRRLAGSGGFRFEASPYTAQPFVCFDELADAPDAVRGEVAQLLYGEREILQEGQRLRLAPATMACFNPPEGSRAQFPVLTKGTWRRVLRLCTAPVVPCIPGDLGQRLGRQEGTGWPAPVELGELRWPAQRVAPEWAEIWTSGPEQPGVVDLVLSEEGRAWHDWRSLELLALARGARHGACEGELLPSVIGVMYDALLLAETIPGLVANQSWRFPLETLARATEGHAGAEETWLALHAGEAGRKSLEQARRAVRSDVEQRSLELVGERAALQERFHLAARSIERVPAAERPEAKGLRAKLNALAKAAGEARRPERLAELEQLGAETVAMAQAIAARLAERRRRDEQERTVRRRQELEEHAAARAARRQLAEVARQALRQRKAVESRLRRQLSELERLYRRVATKPGEDVLERLLEAGCLERRDYVETIERHGLIDRLTGMAGPYQVTRSVWLDASGQSYTAEELSRWGTEAVKVVISARAAQLGRLELRGYAPALFAPLVQAGLPPAH